MLQPEDYERWEQLVAQPTPLSPDGTWLLYGINRSNRQNELRIQPSDGGTAIAIPFGERPVFSEDSKWLAYLIGFSEEQEAKLRKDKKPLHKQLGLLELDGVETGGHVGSEVGGPADCAPAGRLDWIPAGGQRRADLSGPPRYALRDPCPP